MFLLKKIVTPFFMPLTMGLFLSILGLFLLWFSKRRGKTGKVLVTLGVLLITALSYGRVADRLLAPLEQRYPPLLNSELASLVSTDNRRPIRYVVVLGGGHVSDRSLPVSSQIGEASLFRLVEGIRLYRALPGSRLILSGGKVFDPVSDAAVMAETARSLGVPASDLLLEDRSRDTKDEARIIRSMVGNDRFVLVTSASHMPRAMALFESLGMHPVPAPTHYLAIKPAGMSPGDFFPGPENLKKADRAIYEQLGMLWAKLRGQITASR